MFSLPRPLPKPVYLFGRYCRLELLQRRHGESLYASSMAGDAEVVAERFRYLGESPQTPDEFGRWIEGVLQITNNEHNVLRDPLFFAVIDLATERCHGRQALMRFAPEHGAIEIGHILWGSPIARTRVATEAIFVTLQYLFDALGYRRVEWKCNALNQPSRRAALRFGFQFEGIFRQHMVVKGQNRDTAWFAMLDQDWEPIKAAYQAWLAPDNFDQDGRQKSRLQTPHRTLES